HPPAAQTSALSLHDALPIWAGLAADRSLAAHRQGRDAAAEQLADDALALAVEAGDPDALARAHGMLGMLAVARGDHDGARRHLEDRKSTRLNSSHDQISYAG